MEFNLLSYSSSVMLDLTWWIDSYYLSWGILSWMWMCTPSPIRSLILAFSIILSLLSTHCQLTLLPLKQSLSQILSWLISTVSTTPWLTLLLNLSSSSSTTHSFPIFRYVALWSPQTTLCPLTLKTPQFNTPSPISLLIKHNQTPK